MRPLASARLVLALIALTACGESVSAPESPEPGKSKRTATVQAHLRQEDALLLVGLMAECEPENGKVVTCGAAAGVPVFLTGTMTNGEAVSARLGVTDGRGILKIDLDRTIDPKAVHLPSSARLACAPPGATSACRISNAPSLLVDLKPVADARDDAAWSAALGTCACKDANVFCKSMRDACGGVKAYLDTFGEDGKHTLNAVALLDEREWAVAANACNSARTEEACEAFRSFLTVYGTSEPVLKHSFDSSEILAAARQVQDEKAWAMVSSDVDRCRALATCTPRATCLTTASYNSGCLALEDLRFPEGSTHPAEIQSVLDLVRRSLPTKLAADSEKTRKDTLDEAARAQAAAAQAQQRAGSRAMELCYKLQAAGIATDCRPTNGSPTGDEGGWSGVVDGAAFHFTAQVAQVAQGGRAGVVLQFRNAASYESVQKWCRGWPCLGSPSALLVVKTVWPIRVIPDRDWNKVQGVLNLAGRN